MWTFSVQKIQSKIFSCAHRWDQIQPNQVQLLRINLIGLNLVPPMRTAEKIFIE